MNIFMFLLFTAAIKTGRYSYEMRTFAMRESRRVRTLVEADEKLYVPNSMQTFNYSPLSSSESAKSTYSSDNVIMEHKEQGKRSDLQTIPCHNYQPQDLAIHTSRNIQIVPNV